MLRRGGLTILTSESLVFCLKILIVRPNRRRHVTLRPLRRRQLTVHPVRRRRQFVARRKNGGSRAKPSCS